LNFTSLKLQTDAVVFLKSKLLTKKLEAASVKPEQQSKASIKSRQ
jgi:hypothetical protein